MQSPPGGLRVRDLAHAGLAREGFAHDRVDGARVHERLRRAAVDLDRHPGELELAHLEIDAVRLAGRRPGIDVDVLERRQEIHESRDQAVAIPDGGLRVVVPGAEVVPEHGALRERPFDLGSFRGLALEVAGSLEQPPGPVVVAAREQHLPVERELRGILLELLARQLLQILLQLREVAPLQALLRVEEKLRHPDVVLGQHEDVGPREDGRAGRGGQENERRQPRRPPTRRSSRSQSSPHPPRGAGRSQRDERAQETLARPHARRRRRVRASESSPSPSPWPAATAGPAGERFLRSPAL